MSSTSPALVSIVVPAYNEQACLPLLVQAVDETFGKTQWDYELIIVNDGSTDDTGQILDDLARRDPRVRGIHLARNFGHQPAMLAGLAESRGRAVITMDADLEQPPAAALTMLELWKSGAQIVHGVRQDHPSTGWWKRMTSRWFYKVLRFLSRIPIEPGMLDFRLYDRTVVDTLLSLPEADFFLRGLSVWVGFTQARLPYQAGQRAAGRTKFHNRAMFSFALRGITSFSTFPLRLATYLGLLMTIVSLAFGSYVGIRHFFWERPQPGYASTILLIAFLMGIQFLLMGLLGEYVGRIHLEVKHRPRYLVARRTPPGSDDKST